MTLRGMPFRGMCAVQVSAHRISIKAKDGPAFSAANTTKSSPFYRFLAERDYSNLIEQLMNEEIEAMKADEDKQREDQETMEALASVKMDLEEKEEWAEDEVAEDESEKEEKDEEEEEEEEEANEDAVDEDDRGLLQNPDSG